MPLIPTTAASAEVRSSGYPATKSLVDDPLVALQKTEVSQAPPTRSHLLKKEMPGLDALRGIAVLAVVFYHGFIFTPRAWVNLPRPRIDEMLARLASGGWLGVSLFFVLSGFLITGILIDTRKRENYWRSFYVRRVLRIIPLYLVVLGLIRWRLHVHYGYMMLCLFNAANLIQYFPTLGAHYDPLWSLAVEEQFYLIWPTLIRKLTLRRLAMVCFGLILVEPFLRAASVARWHWLGDSYATTWLISDYLAWGALLAIFLRSPRATSAMVRKLTVGLVIAGVIMLGICDRMHWLSRETGPGAALQQMPFLMLFAALLLLSLRFGANPVVLRLTAPLRFYGYISYGLYLLHQLVTGVFDELPSTLAVKSISTGDVLYRFFWSLGISTLICFLSRRYFEEYFLRFKDKLVPYNKPKAV
jgi:peptidoglycan/LPS O-acetylase OafA/YrhL